MARIAGVNIPNHQHTVIGLTAIFGIGVPRARKICDAAGVAYDKKVKDLTEGEDEDSAEDKAEDAAEYHNEGETPAMDGGHEDYSDEDDDTMGRDDLSDLDDFLGSLGIDRS